MINLVSKIDVSSVNYLALLVSCIIHCSQDIPLQTKNLLFEI